MSEGPKGSSTLRFVKASKKQALRLQRRLSAFREGKVEGSVHKPGSQNRHKSMPRGKR